MKRFIALLLLLPFLIAWVPAPQGSNTTEDPSQIVVTQLHLFLQREEDRLVVREFYLVSNTGDQTYIGREDPQTGRRLTLAFTFPPDAADLTVVEPQGERWVAVAGGFADTEPIPPGAAPLEIVFQYTLPFAEGMTLERTFPVQVASLAVMATGGDLAAEGNMLTSGGIMDTAMGPIQVYTAGPLDAGRPIQFRVRTEPLPAAEAAPTAPVRNPNLEIVVGLVALAVAVGAAWVLWRPPAPEPVPAAVRPQIEAIAALDADYQAGQVEEEEYRRRREALKREAREKIGASTERRI
jgi:hypothetical protein